MAKIAPWCLASRDNLLAKVPGQVAGWTAPPTLSAHTRNRYRQAFDFQDSSCLTIKNILLSCQLNLDMTIFSFYRDFALEQNFKNS